MASTETIVEATILAGDGGRGCYLLSMPGAQYRLYWPATEILESLTPAAAAKQYAKLPEHYVDAFR